MVAVLLRISSLYLFSGIATSVARALGSARVRRAHHRPVHAAGGGNHDNIGARAARNPQEAFQDAAVIFLILGAADRYDPTASLTRGNFTGH